MIYNPLEQFEITNLHIYHIYWQCPLWDISLTNSSVSLFFVLILFFLFTLQFSRSGYLIPTGWQYLVENIFWFIRDMVYQQNSNKHAIRFFPLIFSLFNLILGANLLGLLPYAFTVTSHMCITFSLSFILFFGITFLGFWLNKFNFLKFFIPSGVPSALLPFLVLIELVSYFIRPFSLAIRLFANMLAGHTLLYILGTFLIPIFFSSWSSLLLLALIPLVLVFLLEFAIAFIQTYVFSILTCIYLNDIYNVSH